MGFCVASMKSHENPLLFSPIELHYLQGVQEKSSLLLLLVARKWQEPIGVHEFLADDNRAKGAEGRLAV